MWIALHSRNVRICHWINVIAAGYLLVSGVHIFLDFPELYWGHTGYQGYPAIFRLSDWGISWDEAGAMGNRMWGRNYHVTFAWVFLINGLVYVGWNIAKRHFRDRMVPAREELTVANLARALRDHLGDVPCAVETERRLGSRLRNHFRRLAEPELRVARSERRHQLRHVLAAVHAPKARGGFQHPGRDPA